MSQALLAALLLIAAPIHAKPPCTGAAGQCVVDDLRGAAASDTALPVPRGTRVSSSYGWRTHPISGKRKFHTGTDFAMSRGSDVLSPGAGTVSFAAWNGGYGRMVRVTLDDGTVVSYAHLKDYAGMKVGTKVRAGDVVGHVNSSGSSTGDHLHLEVKNAAGERQDPIVHFGL
jgi:murein DD-endopeptidase MepM/ murein hydrolase activator NlpD